VSKYLNQLTKSLKPFISLARLNRPTGIWLLFLPCLFGISLSYKSNPTINIYYITSLFFLGAIFMRTAGCIINDIFDRKLDIKVQRTQSRPLASDKINIYSALTILTILLGSGLFILLEFNQLTIYLGIGALSLVILYPLTKRFTYYPQLFLGITYNFGILLASAAINNQITLPIALLYISSIFWTIIYDTIYAYQDIEDDMKVGVKSSAIKFGKSPQKILYTLSAIQISCLAIVGFLSKLELAYYFLIYIALFHLLCQIKSCNFTNPKDCLTKFRSNVLTGFIILMAIFIG
jgi:4-hydroxybenzoate polyprenyltransferase